MRTLAMALAFLLLVVGAAQAKIRVGFKTKPAGVQLTIDGKVQPYDGSTKFYELDFDESDPSKMITLQFSKFGYYPQYLVLPAGFLKTGDGSVARDEIVLRSRLAWVASNFHIIAMVCVGCVAAWIGVRKFKRYTEEHGMDQIRVTSVVESGPAAPPSSEGETGTPG